MTKPTNVTDSATAAEKLAALRHELTARDLAGFIVPHADEYHHEWLPPHAARLAWLTGFDGSAGAAVILANRAAVFVDGRYTLQVRQQVDGDLYDYKHLISEPPRQWLKANIAKGDRIGFDPWLHTQAEAAALAKACKDAGADLVATDENPLDAVWADQPPPPLADVVPHPEIFAGQDSAAKRQQVAAGIKQGGAAAAVISRPDSIAWLLNIRGGDVATTPLPLSSAILHDDGAVELFIDRRKITPETERHLGNHVSIAPPEALAEALDRMAKSGKTIQICPRTAASWIFRRVRDTGGQILEAPDPCELPKARKNQTELDGARAAHRRDGAALSRFLSWLHREVPAGTVTELTAEARLEVFRRQGEHFSDLSFATISGSGPNGAIVHYRTSENTSRTLSPGELYLVDSGGQYLDGTTDVTRTVAIGVPSAEMKDRFTRVLKGHIALARARFPVGTSGAQLDALARMFLWQAGLDYDHGTGHGVGSFLGVHEGPQRISKHGGVALEAGMIVSNEPGYYKEGAYGIRIENLVTVVAVEVAGAEREMLGFETLTLAPIDRNLVDPALLTEDESHWLNGYHERVRNVIGAQLDGEDGSWLEEATRPI